MEILKRAIAAFLALVLVLNIFTFASFYNESYGNTVYAASISDGGVPLYQANVIAKGYNNDGEGYYKLFKSFQDPVYYELTDYMLEDNILCWTSNFWNSAFNSEFQKNPSYFYEVMLMGYLKYEQKEINTSGIWDSKEMALATEIYKQLADQVIGDVETPNYKQFLNQVKNMSNDELKRVLKNVDFIKLSSDILDDLSKGLDYGTEFIDAVAEYEALFDAKSERIESLKLLRTKVTDNDYFTKAVDDIIEKMEQTPINYVAGEMIDKLWDDFLDTAWNLIIEGSPIATVLRAIDIEKMTLDVLFNSSDTASNNFKLLVLYIVDTYFDSALEQSLKNYNSTSSVSNGVTLVQCYKGYIEYQMYGLDYTKTFIKDIVDGGPIHHIIEQIFFEESIQSAEELTRLCDSQISSRQRLLELLEKSADIYYGKTGLNKLVDALNETEEQNVPVTSISFKQSEITLKSTKDICMISADVYPVNATNKNVIYTSSNPDILSVPNDGGFADIKGTGTVTITAKTEDGGYTATQKVTIGETKEFKVGDVFTVGDFTYKIYEKNSESGEYYLSIEFFNNRGQNEVVIGKGFKYGNEKLIIRKIGNSVFKNCESLTNVTIPDSITSIGAFAFYNCRNLTNISFPDSITSIGGRAFENCELIEKINLPPNLQELSAETFEGTKWFKQQNDGLLYLDNWLLGYKHGNSMDSDWFRQSDLGVFNIKAGTIGIASRAMHMGNYGGFDTVIFPECLKYICSDSFFGVDNCCTYVFKGQPEVIADSSIICTWNGRHKEGIILFGKPGGSVEEYALKFGIKFVSIDEYEYDKKFSVRVDKETGGITVERILVDKDAEIPSSLYGMEVTCIGDGACLYSRNIESLVLPDTLKRIKDGAFAECTKLKKVIIPDSVEFMERSIFGKCEALEEVILGAGLREINVSVCANCHNLKKVTIKSQFLKEIPDDTFSNCYALNDIILPDSITGIGDEAFYCCTNLTDIIIPRGVTNIGSKAFTYCNLTDIIIPNGVTNIGSEAFRNCNNLTNVTIGNSVTSIGDSAFSYCRNISNTNYTGTINQWAEISFSDMASNPIYYSENLYINNELVIEVNLTTAKRVSEYAFKNCKSLTTVTIPASVVSIGDDTFDGCTNLINITVDDKNSQYSSLEGVLFNKDKTCLILYPKGNVKVDYTIPDSVTSIYYSAFYQCDNIEDVYYSANEDSWNTISIGEYNDILKSVNLHLNAVKDDYIVSERIEPDCEDNGKITYTCPHGFIKTEILSALGHNNIVKEIIPSTCNKGGYTVYECDRCGETYESDYTSPLGHDFINGICKNCGKSEDECIESPHPYEDDCNEIWTINKPGAKSISVTFSKNTEVEYDCDYIYILDQNGNEVGCYTGDSLASKTITVSGDTVKIRLVSDESSTYYGFSLTSVKANYNEPAKFNDFEYLLLDDGTIEITRYVGSDTKLIIPDKINGNRVTRIGNNAFYNCTNIEAIEMPTTIKNIGYNAFYGCTELEDVYYNGDSDYDLDELIEIDDGNDSLLYDASIHYYHMKDDSDNQPNNAKWSIDENGTLYWSEGNVNEDGYSLEEEIPWYDQRDKIKNVVIGDGVDYISNYTFMYCENLEKITIPAGVTSIGSLAFWNCDNLKSINIAENNLNYTSVDGVLFNKNKTEIVKYPNAKEGKYVISNTVTTIGTHAFRECGKLSELVISDSVTTIDTYAFYDCTSLLNVTIPRSVTKMEGCGLGLLFYKGGDDKIKGFVMKGYTGTAAESYARDNGLTFEDITNVISNPETTTVPLTKPIVQEKTTSAEDKPNNNLTQKKAATTKIKKIKGLKKSLKVTWKKVKGVSGYQIQYSTSSKFKKAKKITIKNAKTTSKTIKKLKVKKKYYVRIRTYITVNGKKKYSSWSKKKSQKIK